MEIGLDATVVAGAGDEIGQVRLVLIGSTNNLLSHVVVEGPDKEKRAIPIWAIERGEGNEVLLKADAPAWDQFPAYHTGRRDKAASGEERVQSEHEPGEFPALFPEDGSLPQDAIALGAGVPVECGDDGRAGEIVGVVADDYTAEVTIFYVQLTGKTRKTVAVPSAWSRSLTASRALLACSRSQLADLPESRMDTPETPIEPLQRG